MVRFKRSVCGVIVLVVVAVVGGMWLMRRSQKVPVQVPAKPAVNQPETSEVLSGDGMMSLTMRKESQADGSHAYAFGVIGKDKSERVILTTTMGPGGEMGLHHNSWSPDSKYVLIEEKDGPGPTNVLVLKVSGEVFKNGAQSLNVNTLFAQKVKGLLLRDVTGWASDVFVNIRTGSENKPGPAFWLDVTSQGFLEHI